MCVIGLVSVQPKRALKITIMYGNNRLFQFYCVAKMPEKFTNLPTIMSSRSVDCGLIRVQMSMVNRVLLLLKMEAKEDIRAANITASIRPRKPAAERRQEGRWVEDRGQGEETSPLNWVDQSCYVSLPFGMMDTTSLG